MRGSARHYATEATSNEFSYLFGAILNDDTFNGYSPEEIQAAITEAINKILVMDCVACLVYEFPKSPIRFRLNRYYEVRDDETGLWNGEFYTNNK